MKRHKVSLAAIALWGVTIALVAFMIIRGQTETAADGRTAVVLSVAERDHILGEMRGMLGSIQGIISAMADGNMEDVARVAAESGISRMQHENPALILKMPLDFKQMGKAAHQGFDEIALTAPQGKDALLKRLDQQLSVCMACHENYKFKAE
ncbi:MAG: hypothetical protein A3G18_13385 [Rhodospirillales bacterium RIFCSPLOWO2_12_FULL_58_28]|nr:MAG: hypothetical protein A3H92_13240 [Rhodospirillales bacterium RIFCSPLOWO2_02_FULL_58_16]OHC78568.1 MAG: hypothetical protein A3G18_13385 [Rhodospirillales bacterium RIFCSPLOWO2_12_FULL_58_28]